jgi:hypothetical protein
MLQPRFSSNAVMNTFGRFFKNKGSVFMLIITISLAFFEMFNYSTTEYSLRDLLGSLSFAGMSWSTILALAFCGIDFAGIARLFTPEVESKNEPAEVWYLFGAWVLAAGMNAVLTWWGVSVAIATNIDNITSTKVATRDNIMTIAPIMVALLVWIIRLCLIGTFASHGDKMFNGKHSQYRPEQQKPQPYQPQHKPGNTPSFPRPTPTYSARPQEPYHSIRGLDSNHKQPSYLDPLDK